MKIILYNNLSEENRINKNLDEVETLTGTIRDKSTSIENPIIRISRASPTGFNYVEIPAFDRFYFVQDVTIEINGILLLNLAVDRLQSFKDSILQQEIIVEQSTNSNDVYLPDNNWLTNVKTKTDILNFSNGFLDNGEFILITAGG